MIKKKSINKITTPVLLVISFVTFIFTSSITAQDTSKTGDFDIKKVHQAVKGDLADSLDVAADNAEVEPIRPLGDNYMFIVVRIIGYLILLTIVIILVVWLLKRFGITGSSRIGSGTMDLLESLPLGQNRSIILVRVMDTILVLSQTAQNITLLEKIEGDKAVELIASTKGGTSIVHFKDVFNNFIGKMKKTS